MVDVIVREELFMKRKQVLAYLMVLSMAAAIALPSLNVEAKNLTQATSANQVKYGKLTKNDLK